MSTGVELADKIVQGVRLQPVENVRVSLFDRLESVVRDVSLNKVSDGFGLTLSTEIISSQLTTPSWFESKWL